MLRDETIQRVLKFRDDRNWRQFHTPKDLAISMNLEAAELLTVRSVEHNGRLRKYYHITQAGLDRLAAFSREWREIMSIYRFVTREGGDQ